MKPYQKRSKGFRLRLDHPGLFWSRKLGCVSFKTLAFRLQIVLETLGFVSGNRVKKMFVLSSPPFQNVRWKLLSVQNSWDKVCAQFPHYQALLFTNQRITDDQILEVVLFPLYFRQPLMLTGNQPIHHPRRAPYLRQDTRAIQKPFDG